MKKHTHNTKDRVTRTPLKTGGECSLDTRTAINFFEMKYLSHQNDNVTFNCPMFAVAVRLDVIIQYHCWNLEHVAYYA